MISISSTFKAARAKMEYETEFERLQVSKIRLEGKYRIAEVIVKVELKINNKENFNQNRDEIREEIINELVIEVIPEGIREQTIIFKRGDFVMPISHTYLKKYNNGSFKLKALYQVDPSKRYYNEIHEIETQPRTKNAETQTQNYQSDKYDKPKIYEQVSEEDRNKIEKYEKIVKRTLATHFPEHENPQSDDNFKYFDALSKYRNEMIKICIPEINN